jgi:hypothetical protein
MGMSFLHRTTNVLDNLTPGKEEEMSETTEFKLKRRETCLFCGAVNGRIETLEKLLETAFEIAIAPLGAGETLQPSAEHEKLAQEVFKAIDKK